MKKMLLGLAALPFMAGAAMAGHPLTPAQMDGVTAGFTSIAIADASGLVNRGSLLLTTTGTVSQVNVFATATGGEVTITAFKSISGAQSSSVSASIPTVGLGLPE
jgi:hypothetical protein